MKNILVVCAAAAVLVTAAPAQDLPKLSEFLSGCFRDSTSCRGKLKDYIFAAESQKIICRPKDVSVNEASGEMLRWLRSEENYPAALRDGPYDDALFEAAKKLYPCKQEPPPPPPPPAPTDQPAPAEQPAAPAPTP